MLLPSHFLCFAADGGDQGGVGSESRWPTATIEAGGRHVCLPAPRWPTRTAAAAASVVPSNENWTKFDQSTKALDPPTRKRLAQQDLEHGHDQHTEASRAGLEHARNSARRPRLKTPALDILQRRNRIQEHLLRRAFDGRPLSLRHFYESYRLSIGATTTNLASTRLKFILKSICNDTAGVEYLM
jgi:hypothetical protein